MRIWEPWETAWPAGAALLVVAVALGAGAWRHVEVHRRERGLAAAVLVVALVVRFFVVPAWTRHAYDGHEAEYWDLFRGARVPNRGGTVLYPSMQWLWWGLGRVLPAWPRLPVVLSAGVGSVGALLVGGMVRRLVAPWAGWVAAGLVALHPAHAAWSSSAYNVVLPQVFGAGVLWCGAVLATRRRAPRAVAWLGAGLFALTVATRLDAALVCVPAAMLVLLVAAPELGVGPWLRDRAALLPALAVGLALAGLAAWPLVFPGEVPGAGERALSFSVNVGWLAPYLPRLAGGWLLLAAAGALLAGTRWPAATAALGVGAVLNHLALATFDDLGDRHALTALPAITFAVAAGAARLRARWRVAGGAVAVVGGALLVAGLVDLRPRFYGAEEAYADRLATGPWADLPRWTAERARAEDGGACGWVAEDPRVAGDPVASHFNLLVPEEAAALRGPTGCLRWCADVQDWRWSSRGVRDRARRVAHLYAVTPRAVVTEPDSGYACLVLDVGRRRCCGADADPGGNGAPLSGVGSPEEDERAARPHPPLP